jgi:hypothetical protein
MKMGRRHGNGIFYYVDGSRYEGDWIQDKREGRGKFFYLDGDIYEGEFKSGTREG